MLQLICGASCNVGSAKVIEWAKDRSRPMPRTAANIPGVPSRQAQNALASWNQFLRCVGPSQSHLRLATC